MTALARELIAFLSGSARQPSLDAAKPQTLEQLVNALPTLGIRRVILISLQLATELDLASASGVVPGPITLANVRIERLGTPFEQALLPGAGRGGGRTMTERMMELAVLMSELLAHPGLYLEQSLRVETTSFRRRADRELFGALRRALALIAEHCGSGSDRYTNAFDVVADLSKLASIATRIVQSRQTLPVLALHRPRPCRQGSRRLPKVIVRAKVR